MKHTFISVILISAGVWLVGTGIAQAHCDTLDGPVVSAAKAALEKGDVTPVLKWVKSSAEKEIRDAFKNTLAVRGKSPEAKALADMYFFETLVRIHRAGEGAPYSGLQPAGTVEPPIAAADKALETGKVDELLNDTTKAIAEGIRHRFAKAIAARKHADDNVEAGREYVEAYVDYVHYVERLHGDAAGTTTQHEEPAPQHHH